MFFVLNGCAVSTATYSNSFCVVVMQGRILHPKTAHRYRAFSSSTSRSKTASQPQVGAQHPCNCVAGTTSSNSCHVAFSSPQRPTTQSAPACQALCPSRVPQQQPWQPRSSWHVRVVALDQGGGDFEAVSSDGQVNSFGLGSDDVLEQPPETG